MNREREREKEKKKTNKEEKTQSTIVRIHYSCSLSLSLHIITIKNRVEFYFSFYLFIQSLCRALFNAFVSSATAVVKCVRLLNIAFALPLIDDGTLCARRVSIIAL